jgi:hypothetical protein
MLPVLARLNLVLCALVFVGRGILVGTRHESMAFVRVEPTETGLAVRTTLRLRHDV